MAGRVRTVDHGSARDRRQHRADQQDEADQRERHPRHRARAAHRRQLAAHGVERRGLLVGDRDVAGERVQELGVGGSERPAAGVHDLDDAERAVPARIGAATTRRVLQPVARSTPG
jgi:hypothetical protein